LNSTAFGRSSALPTFVPFLSQLEISRAAFRKRSNGWQVRIRRKGYPEVNKSFPARKKAESWARGIESEIDRGVFVSRVEADNTTLAELLNRYLKEIRPQKKRASLMGVKTILTKAQSTAGATGKRRTH